MSSRNDVATAASGPSPHSSEGFLASQPPPSGEVLRPGRMMLNKFRKHRMAVVGGYVTVAIVLVAIFAGFLAPFASDRYDSRFPYAPPQSLKLVEATPEGWTWGLYVNGYTVELDRELMRRTYVVDEAIRHDVSLFVHGAPYHLFGFIPTDIHLIGPADQNDPMFLLGADRLGRDVLSRTIHGTTVSISIGLVGVAISLLLGILLGGLSGYYGGWIDNLTQRTIEFLQAIPAIPLWMGLAAAIPQTWSPLQIYFTITIILSVIGWTGLARVVRGRFLSLKTEDFITAAKLDGASDLGIILRYMVPSFSSHIIAVVTLAIPGMILAETALSFLGIGLRPPAVSWGVLLQEAQNIRSVAMAPWLFWPGAFVVVTVLAFNFLGDGLRDAADPYEDHS